MKSDQKLKQLKAQRLQIMNAMASMPQATSEEKQVFTDCEKHLKELENRINVLRETT